MKNDSVLSVRANDLSDKLCVCRHIVFEMLIEILCSSYQKNTGPWQAKKLVLACALHLFSKTWSDSGLIGESRCKAARRGHTLCSRKINNVKSKETGGWKPPDTNLFLTVCAFFFFYNFIQYLFLVSLLSPLFVLTSCLQVTEGSVCVSVCVCVFMNVAEVDMLPGCVLDAPVENFMQCFSQ